MANPGTNAGTLAVTTSGGTLDFTNVTVVAEIGTTPQFAFSTNAVTLTSCFASGTMIELDCGPAPVERFGWGDATITEDGEFDQSSGSVTEPTDCHAIRTPKRCPVHIQGHAFGPGRPARELLLSPDHAVFIDGVLVPVKLLINGKTIRQIPGAIASPISISNCGTMRLLWQSDFRSRATLKLVIG